MPQGPQSIKPLKFDAWKSQGHTAPGGYQGYLDDFNKKQSQAKTDLAPIDLSGVPKQADGTTRWVDAQKTGVSYDDWKAGNEKVRLGSVGGQDVNIDPELAQQGIVEASMKKTSEIGEKFGLETGPDTIEGVVSEFKEKQAEESQFVSDQIAQQEALDRAETARFGRTADAAQAANKATFAGGRETPQSGTAPTLMGEFRSEMQSRKDEAQSRLKLANDRRTRLMKQLQDAQRDGQHKLAENIQKQLGAAQVQIDDAKAGYQEALNEGNRIAMDNLKIFTSLSDSMTEGFAERILDMDTQSIMDTFGVDGTMANIVQMSAKNISKLNPNDPDYRLKLAQAKKAEAEALNSGLTQEQRNYLFAADLTGVAKEEFLNFAGKNPSYGFTTIGNKIFATNPLTGSVEQVAGTSGGGQKLVPSGKFASGKINGKSVTLDQNALFGLQTANGAAVEAGVGEINVSSHTRDQKQTILGMAAKWGVEVDPASIDSVNQAAATLTAMGHSVAPVGQSNHEHGLAIDIYPSDPASQDNASAQAYIAKVKPFLEANGWKQSTDPGDKGHFNYVGMTIYSDEQEAVMNSINMDKYDGTDAKSLADADLTYSDLASYRSKQGFTPEQKKAAENVKIKTQAALNAIKDIEDRELWKGAGFSSKIFPRLQLTVDDLNANIDTILSNIALDEMKSLKEASKTGSTGFGAMNEKELTLLTSAKGTLRPQMSEELFNQKLGEIKTILEKANGISQSPSTDPSSRRVVTDQAQIDSIHNELTRLQNEENHSDEELIQYLESKGIDSSTFFK